MPNRQGLLVFAGMVAGLAMIAGPCAAQQPGRLDDLNNQIDTGAAVKGVPDPAAPPKKGVTPLVVPLPLSDPALGSGAVLVGALFYNPVAGGRQWVTGVGGLYTNQKDWALGVAQQADLFKGKLRLKAFAGYGDFLLDFFGIGQNAGAAGRSIKLHQTGELATVDTIYQVTGKLFGGLRWRALSETTTLAEPLFPGHPILPEAQLKTQISGLGPSFEYDSRDLQFRPTKGLYAEGQWLVYNKALGSTFDYDKLNLAGNAYFPLGRNTVIAARASLCDSSSGAPFYDLCMYGSSHDLRGYQGGQYRDHVLVAGQVELRQHLFWRFGAVAFGGVGTVSDKFADLGSAPALPAGGAGLRFQPSAKLPINISVDYASGKNSQGLYLYVGEAF